MGEQTWKDGQVYKLNVQGDPYTYWTEGDKVFYRAAPGRPKRVLLVSVEFFRNLVLAGNFLLADTSDPLAPQ